MANESIQGKYQQQLAEVLATNRELQAELRTRLLQLEAEERALVSAQQVSSSTPYGTPDAAHVAEAEHVPEAVGQETAVPQPRQEDAPSDEEDVAASEEAAHAKKAAVRKSAAKRPSAKKPSAKKPAAKKVAEPEPTAKAGPKKGTSGRSQSGWSTVVEDIFDRKPGEPLNVNEVHALLELDSPDRVPDINVLRNVLERGVAKGAFERTRQGRSVFYTKTRAGSASRSTDAESSAASDVADNPTKSADGKPLVEA